MKIQRMVNGDCYMRALSVVHTCGHEVEYTCYGEFIKRKDRDAYREAWRTYAEQPCEDCKKELDSVGVE